MKILLLSKKQLNALNELLATHFNENGDNQIASLIQIGIKTGLVTNPCNKMR